MSQFSVISFQSSVPCTVPGDCRLMTVDFGPPEVSR